MTRSSIRRGVAVPFVLSAILVSSGCGQPGTAPGDATADRAAGALTQDAVVPTGQACTPTGKHGEHARFACATCHQCAGTLSFNPSVAGQNAAFDATTKTCSSVACHSVPAGTYTYYTYDYETEQTVANSVPYGGSEGSSGANWYAPSGMSCNACHGYPPKYNGTAYAWHTGMHGYGTNSGNACTLCHPDASGAYVYGGPPSYVGTSAGLISSCPQYTFCAAPGAITNTSLHGNGTVEVTARFTSGCIGCH